MENLTAKKKLQIVSNAPEILNAVKLLAACFLDNDLKDNITLRYHLLNDNYELKFSKVTPPISNP
jgi:hypothetical protein